MRILVLCPHFAPDVAPTGEVMTSIVEGLTADGHEVEVVTSLPWYRHHAVEDDWKGRPWRRQVTGWGRITRVHPFPTDKANIPARAVAFGGFTALAGVAALFQRRRPHVVLAMSPPLTLGLAGWIVARARRVPFVFNIQDVFPDVAIEAGVLRGPRAIRLFSWLERFTYRRADAVTVLSEDLRANLVAKLGSEDGARVQVIPNFIDTGLVQPRSRQNAYRTEHGLEGRQVVMYAGNLGFSQPVDLLLDAAEALADRDVLFVINGGGAARGSLEARAADAANVRFVDLQPKERLADVLAAADIHVVLLRTGLAHSSVPSKLFSILAAARPLVASVDGGTEVARVVERAGAGLTVPPDDAAALTEALVQLLDDPDGARAAGERGRSFVESWPGPEDIAARYAALFDDLCSRLGRR